jgi:hypothetical protein
VCARVRACVDKSTLVKQNGQGSTTVSTVCLILYNELHTKRNPRYFLLEQTTKEILIPEKDRQLQI